MFMKQGRFEVLVLTHLDRDTHTDSSVEVFSESVTEMMRLLWSIYYVDHLFFWREDKNIVGFSQSY